MRNGAGERYYFNAWACNSSRVTNSTAEAWVASQINRAGDAVVERFFPTGHADAPFVARLEPGKFPFRMRRDQVVSLQH